MFEVVGCILGSVELLFMDLVVVVCAYSRQIKSPKMRHIYSLVWGMLFLLFTYGFGGIVVIGGSSMLVYSLSLLLPRKNLPFLIFVLSFGILSLMHFYRMQFYWMIYEMDLTSIGLCVPY